jgi:ubiquinone biosynthesis protein UbiJ
MAITEQLMLKQALSAILEKIINQALRLNLNTQVVKQLQALEGKQLTLVLKELGFPLTFTITAQQVLVTNISDTACQIITSIQTLKQLKASQQLTELIKHGQLDIQGELKIAQQFAALAENIEIDWQSELAKHIGDVPTYKLGRLGQLLQQKLTFVNEQIQADCSEWLVHEKKLVVTKYQLDAFNKSVAQLNNNTDQLFLRLLAVEKQLEQ